MSKIQKQVKQTAYISDNGFIHKFQKLIKEVVIPYQYSVLEDKAEGNVEKSHVIQNFINAGNVLAGKGQGDGFYGMVFQDSDAAKWIEAVGYSLAILPDPELESLADKFIDIIAAAQDTDGYLNTYFTIKDKEKRWTNLLEGHELYCAGHMLEAACAYYESTGKKTLLNVMIKNVEHIYSVFMNESDEMKFNGIPGHPEVELALMKLYSLTGLEHALELAKHFIDKRGTDPHYFEKETKNRNWGVWGSDGKDVEYNQANKPIRELNDATGHAVRAVYLYTGVAEVASQTNDKTLVDACKRLWDSVTKRRMYITGGIGSTNQGEAFTVDYDLPSDTAYCETCASIGLIFFASRMLEMEINRKYADVMEKAFYNTVLAGMQEDGKRFFYVNPLEVIPGIAGVAKTHTHDLPQRPTWYACACCPPNVSRLITSFGKYAYGENKDTVFCHLFAAGTVTFENGVKIKCDTMYPYDFSINYTIENTPDNMCLAVRIPAWSKDYKIIKNNEEVLAHKFKIECGYIYIPILKEDKITIELDSYPYFVFPSPKIPDLSGQIAICRGPLVYCAEGIDNKTEITGLFIKKNSGIIKTKELENGITTLIVRGARQENTEDLYLDEEPNLIEEDIIMRPYYSWGNRGLTQMKIWFPYFDKKIKY